MLPKDLVSDLVKRLHYIQGQLGGIEKMLVEGRDPDQIIIQFKAAEKGLNTAHFKMLDETFRKGLAIKLSEAINSCPGDCMDAENIALLKQKFPNLQLDEITEKMKEVSEINERMAQVKEGKK